MSLSYLQLSQVERRRRWSLEVLVDAVLGGVLGALGALFVLWLL